MAGRIGGRHQVYDFGRPSNQSRWVNLPECVPIGAFEHNVSVNDHIERLPDTPTQGDPPALGVNPLCSIQYKDCAPPPDPIPIRNFLIGKKQGENASDSIFKVHPLMDDQSRVSYSVEVDKDFLSKMYKTLKSPSIAIDLGIGRNKELLLKTEGGQQSVIREKRWTTFKGEVIVTPNENTVPLTLDTFWDAEISTKVGLVRQSKIANASLSFLLTVSIKFDDVRLSRDFKKIGIKLNSASILMYWDDSTKDLTIVANNGAEVKCHQAIIMSHSVPFERMLDPENGMLEARDGKIEMLENSADGLELFVKFLYGFPIKGKTLTPDFAVELFQLGNKYDVKELEEGLTEFLTTKRAPWFTADSLIELYFIARNIDSLEELKIHALTEMCGIPPDTLKGCEYFRELPQGDKDLLNLTLLQWKENI